MEHESKFHLIQIFCKVFATFLSFDAWIAWLIQTQFYIKVILALA